MLYLKTANYNTVEIVISKQSTIPFIIQKNHGVYKI